MKPDSVIIIIKQPLERIPPIINLIDVLVNTNISVNIVSTEIISDVCKTHYGNKVNFIMLNIRQETNKLKKVFAWLKFRINVFHYLEENKLLVNKSVLWIGSADAALALGKKLFKYKYIFQCHELYDAFPFYKKRLKNVMDHAHCVVNPSEERGAIFRSWYKLRATPITLPNKPFHHPRNKNIRIENIAVRNIIDKIRDKKILLYQGGIVAQRDIRKIAAAVRLIQNEWVLILMGNTDHTDYLKNILNDYPETIHIDRIPAPTHLQITSWARIGIVSYSYDDLNHVFCAPNKTWEYTGFSIPLLGNNVPGITSDVYKFNMGETVDMENSSIYNIVAKIELIDKEYTKYSKGAMDFYESIDVSKIIKYIVESY